MARGHDRDQLSPPTHDGRSIRGDREHGGTPSTAGDRTERGPSPKRRAGDASRTERPEDADATRARRGRPRGRRGDRHERRHAEGGHDVDVDASTTLPETRRTGTGESGTTAAEHRRSRCATHAPKAMPNTTRATTTARRARARERAASRPRAAGSGPQHPARRRLFACRRSGSRVVHAAHVCPSGVQGRWAWRSSAGGHRYNWAHDTSGSGDRWIRRTGTGDRAGARRAGVGRRPCSPAGRRASTPRSPRSWPPDAGDSRLGRRRRPTARPSRRRPTGSRQELGPIDLWVNGVMVGVFGRIPRRPHQRTSSARCT